MDERFITNEPGFEMSDPYKEAERLRKFQTGATRDTAEDKPSFRCLHPLVLKRYAEFMHRNRFQRDGTVREPDNWTRGMPRLAYLDSLERHVLSVKLYLSGHGDGVSETLQDALAAVIFNAMGLLLELLLQRDVEG